VLWHAADLVAGRCAAGRSSWRLAIAALVLGVFIESILTLGKCIFLCIISLSSVLCVFAVYDFFASVFMFVHGRICLCLSTPRFDTRQQRVKE
jgi:hypothetical protein